MVPLIFNLEIILLSAFFFSRLAKNLLFFSPSSIICAFDLNIYPSIVLSMSEFSSDFLLSICCFSKFIVALFTVLFIVLFKFSISVVSCFSSLSFIFLEPYLIDSFLIEPFTNFHRVFGFAFSLIDVISVIFFFLFLDTVSQGEMNYLA